MLHHAIHFDFSGVFPVNQQFGINRDVTHSFIISDQVLKLLFGHRRGATGNHQNRTARVFRP